MAFVSAGIEPSLIHAVDITIQRLDLQATFQDDIYREPQATAQLMDEEFLLAQIHWGPREGEPSEEIIPRAGGDDNKVMGWITTQRSAIEDLPGGALKKNDRIVEIDGEDYRDNPLIVVARLKAAHYTTFRLWKFFFTLRDQGFI